MSKKNETPKTAKTNKSEKKVEVKRIQTDIKAGLAAESAEASSIEGGWCRPTW